MDLLTRMDGRGLWVEELGGLEEEEEVVGDKRGTATQAMNEPGATCVHHPPALSSPHKESNRNIFCGLRYYYLQWLVA